MRFFRKIFFVVIGTAFFSSCLIVHKGNVSSGPLLNINDRYVDIASGEAKSYLVFGIGGYENDVLLLDAKKNLFKNRPLAKNEYYANFTSDISRKYIVFPIVAINKVTLSAEVLKTNITDTNYLFFNDKRVLKIDEINTVDNTNLEKIGNVELNTKRRKEINTGDSVYFYSMSLKKFNLYVATEIDKENVMLKPIDKTIKNVLTSLNNTFYYKNIEFNNLKYGDKVSIEIEDDTRFANKIYEGKVLGIGKKTILVQTNEGNYYSAEPKVVKKIN